MHYLDDFLLILPPLKEPASYRMRFAELYNELGLLIKESKNEEGTRVSFGGVEIDTENMVIRLPIKKLLKVHTIVQAAAKQTLLSLQDLQSLTGYLNFAAVVVPLGRTFLRRL